MAVTSLIAHAIYCKHPFLRGSIYYITARTHTKRINTTSIFQCMGNFIAGSSQAFIFRFSVKILVDHGLWMFYTHTYSKRFRLHVNSSFL